MKYNSYICNQIMCVIFQITGEWKGITAGGCPNHPASYPNNPKFKVEIDSTSNNNYLLIELKGPKQYQMGLEVTLQQIKDETITAPFKSKSSGTYRYIVVSKVEYE